MADYNKVSKEIDDLIRENDKARKEAKAAQQQRERILGKPATPADAAKGAVVLIKGSARLVLALLFVLSILGGAFFPPLWLGSIVLLLLALVVKENS